jgi:hypothetical protein
MVNNNIIVLICCALMISCARKKNEPNAEIGPSSNFSFGTKHLGDTIIGSFELKNIGQKDLIIQSVNSSCSCTISTFSTDPIKPNEKGFIKFTYVPEKLDSLGKSKEIIVQTNMKKRLMRLTISGKVVL